MTNRTISDIIEKLSERTRTSGRSSEKGVKKFFEKISKKYLTNEKNCDIIKKLSLRKGTAVGILKIEQCKKSNDP